MDIHKKQVKEKTIATLASDGLVCGLRFLNLAAKKAEIWMKNAYGAIDWENYLEECGDLGALYSECVNGPNAADSFNRQNRKISRKK